MRRTIMQTKNDGRSNLDFMSVPFELKEETPVDDKGIFEGYGAIFNKMDDYRDIFLPGAFTDTLKAGGRNGTGVAMLWMHEAHRPLGVWLEMREDKKGLKVKGQLALGTTDGDNAYKLMLMGALRGLSVGYDTRNAVVEFDNEKRIRLLKERINLWETSPVTFPAMTFARISRVKDIAVDQIHTVRDLEHVLREAGMTRDVSKWVVKLAKPELERLREAERSNGVQLSDVLSAVRDVRREVVSASDWGDTLAVLRAARQ